MQKPPSWLQGPTPWSSPLTVSHRFARDASAPSHSRNGSYGESALEVRGWQEEEEIVQANRRCQDMEYT